MFLQDLTMHAYKDDWTESPNFLQELCIFMVCLFGVFANGEFINSLAYGKLITNPCLLNLAVGNLLAIFCLPLEILNFNSTKVSFVRDIAEGVQVSSLLVHAITRLVQAWRVKHKHCLVFSESEVIWKTADSSYTKSSEEQSNNTLCKGYAERSLSHFKFSERLSLLLTLFIWCLGLCYSLPTLFGLKTFSNYINPDYETFHYYSLLIHVLTLFLIILFLVVFHYQISQSPDAKEELCSERSVVVSLVCLLAGNYFLIFIYITHKHLTQQYLYITARTLDSIQNFPVYITASLVPVVVYCSSASFRTEINQLFRSKKQLKREFRNKIIHI